MKTTKIDIFNKQVSFFPRFSCKEPTKTVSVAEMVLNQNFKDEVEAYRYKNNTKRFLPCFTPSGVFSARNANSLIQHNSIICIDIDKDDNLELEDFSDLKDLIRQIPYVAYCGHSCGGEGYFLLIPIKYPEKHKAHFQALFEDFERCDIKIDRSCSDVCRLRCVSFDDEPYINEDVEVYTRLEEEIEYVKKKAMT